MIDSNISAEKLKVTIGRPPFLAETIVIVNGLPGCGKTMMGPIVSGLKRVELLQYSYEIEYICSLRYLDKIDHDAATALIRLLSDLQLYNVMMSRETNFRWSDISSVRFHPERWKYLKRLFQPGDAIAVDRINEQRPILHLVTHLLLVAAPYLFDALGDRLVFVEVVRHPLYMLKQQHAYMHRYGNDVRDFNVWFEFEGRMLPWFAAGWERKYAHSNSMDQAIHMIDEMSRRNEKVISELDAAYTDRVLVIPFELFVTEPWSYLNCLADQLGTEITSITRRVLKEQKVPRKMYAEGMDRPIYREYGWEPPKPGSTEAGEFERRRDFAAQHASPEAMVVLDRLCHEYEQKYLNQDRKE